MTDRTAAPAPRPAPSRASLGQAVLTVAAAATTSAAVVWSALFYSATNRHAEAAVAAPAAPAQVTAGGTVQRVAAPAPVTTRTS